MLWHSSESEKGVPESSKVNILFTHFITPTSESTPIELRKQR